VREYTRIRLLTELIEYTPSKAVIFERLQAIRAEEEYSLRSEKEYSTPLDVINYMLAEVDLPRVEAREYKLAEVRLCTPSEVREYKSAD
jgi:hypothetical protein